MSIERVGRRFYLNRLVDVSGISGTGPVADGVEFSDHVCVIHWRNYRSISIYRNAEDMMLVHGHDGKTVLVWIDS